MMNCISLGNKEYFIVIVIVIAYNGINIFCNSTSIRFQNKEIVKNIIF